MGFIIFLVVILFLLAVTDLIVGVSNDAVNFLNSAIGSRVAKFGTIILIASAGVILGSVFSSGIMEIARKGIFHPQFFTFDKIMWVFLAVMLTDIVLLDIFNTLGLPTSTTVSVVFELLGAALVTGVLISFEKQAPATTMMQYINTSQVITIISGIFLSIIIAFTSGIILQYLCRLVFTFDYEKNLKKYGAIFAGIGLSSIVYFLLIKGLKGTTLVNASIINWVSTHTLVILLILFVSGMIISFLLQRLIRLNPLKLVVLIGTFALAMAFAGNDLVNFIGVPITGFLAFQNWQSSGLPPDQSYQGFLASNDVIVPNYMLVIAGIIMALTLWLSAKARKVTDTEVSLGSQNEGEEKFQPNAVSRRIVKTSILIGNMFSVILPEALIKFYNLSFAKSKMRQATIVQERPAFDLVRASSNLVIASVLIAWATSMKLPLSTTYVSFMVAMGTSLADKAWGRESAVYRVAGVLSVIGGWFITAIIAFSVSGLFALILNKGGMTGTIILLVLVTFYIIFSHVTFYKKQRKALLQQNKIVILESEDLDIYDSHKNRIIENLKEINLQYNVLLEGLRNNEEEMIESAFLRLKELNDYGFKMRAQSIRHIRSLKTDDKQSSRILLYSSDLLQDITNSALNLAEECLHYVKNLHQLPDKGYMEIAEELRFKMDTFFGVALHALRTNNFEDIEYIKQARDDVREFINQQLDKEVALIHEEKPGVKQTILQTAILLQSRDMLAVTLRILKMYRKYVRKSVVIPVKS